jgi:Holliday junction resolvase RusA-like endonuclease
MAGREPVSSPVSLTVTINVEPPASWSQRRKQRAADGQIAPTKKPDASNILKSIEDAMNKVVYIDDSQITRLIVHKQYSTASGVRVVVEQLDQEAA